jgi:hypothetical protein
MDSHSDKDKEQKKILMGYKLMKKLKPVAEILIWILLAGIIVLALKTVIK